MRFPRFVVLEDVAVSGESVVLPDAQPAFKLESEVAERMPEEEPWERPPEAYRSEAPGSPAVDEHFSDPVGTDDDKSHDSRNE